MFYDNNKKSILESKNKTWESSNIITIMYETEAGSGEYQAADSNEWLYDGYIFNTELSKCENGSTLTWDDASKKVLMQANTSDKCYIYFDKIVAVNLVEYITTQVYTGVDGENSLYYHDGTGSYTNSNQEIGDDSYRYSGKTPNNYVCFGSDEESCPEDNLYRIIGVFDNQVKLVKSDILTDTHVGYVDYTHSKSHFCNDYNGNYETVAYYYWSGSSTAGVSWENSSLNKTALNQTYLNNLSLDWQQMIVDHDWKIGGAAYDDIARNYPKVSYGYELGSNSVNKVYKSKIGLMYVNDYAYAVSPSHWNVTLRAYNGTISDNWLYIGTSELLITPRTDSSTYYTFIVYGDEECNGDPNGYIQSSNGGVMRPTFYLNENVLMTSGDGTLLNPYRISL